MQVSILFFLAIFLGVALAQCVEYRCVEPGGNCSVDFAVCKIGSTCKETYPDNYVCVAQLELGGICQHYEDCLDNTENVVCWDHTCQLSYNDRKEGEPCYEVHTCENTLTCNKTLDTDRFGTCIKQIEKGQKCNLTSEYSWCATNLDCNRGICVDIFSIPIGGVCDVPFACVASSWCKQNDPNDTSSFPIGTCTKNIPSSNALCPNWTCSNPDEYCECIDGVKKCLREDGFSEQQAKVILAFNQCVDQNNCNGYDGATCCSDLFCDYYHTVIKEEVLDSCGFGGQYAHCNSSPSSNHTAVIVVVVLLVVASAIGAGAFYVYKKKNNPYRRL